MAGFRNNLESYAFEQTGNLAHSGVSTCILFAADQKYGNRRCFDGIRIVPDRTDHRQNGKTDISVGLCHLFEKKAELRLAGGKTVLGEKRMRPRQKVFSL